MLTRLKVNGFKNLVDVDVRFGPFTCVAGENGVGKSNLFDAIRFLSLLADKPLVEAARLIRSSNDDVDGMDRIFQMAPREKPEGKPGEQIHEGMYLEAEMIVPSHGIDELGQPVQPSANFLRYSLYIARRYDASRKAPYIEIFKEELTQLNETEIEQSLLFLESSVSWRKSQIIADPNTPAFITTKIEGNKYLINLLPDRYNTGGTVSRPASNIPRTIVSVANTAEYPTVLLARREMQSWQVLLLDPAALREPAAFTSEEHLASNGDRLASTIYHLANERVASNAASKQLQEEDSELVLTTLANRLSELLPDVREIEINRDDRIQAYTLRVKNNDGVFHPARSLSDGTLRFIALCVLELDIDARRLLCIEEPENGLHPLRIPAMLTLLQDMATDTREEVSEKTLLRQVIINTHAPAIVALVPEDSLIIAEVKERIREGVRSKHAVFSYLPNTWRAKAPDANVANISALGKLIAYLNPTGYNEDSEIEEARRETGSEPLRVIDRPDVRRYILGLSK